MKRFSPSLFASTMLITGGAIAQTPSHATDADTTMSAPVAADNAKANKTDPSNRSMTADKQTNASADIDLTKRIRRSVMADSSLSTYAHNVKIVTVNGSVTLNGVVNNADEKNEIDKKATAIAGAGHVSNDLKVAVAK